MENPRREIVLYRSEWLAIGVFRCRPRDMSWLRRDRAENHLIAIPWSPSVIRKAGERSIVADANTAVLHNRGEEYSARQVVEEGESCVFFAIDSGTIADAVRGFDPGVDDRPERPWSRSHGPCDAWSFCAQRALVGALGRGGADGLWVEEVALRLLGAVAGAAFDAREGAEGSAGAGLAHEARLVLARRFRERLTVDMIAREVGVSAFHLCRQFRRHAGATLFEWRERLRAREGFGRLCDGEEDLAGLALDLGYCHQSHFSHAFARRVGVTPGRARDAARGGKSMSKILQDIGSRAR